MTAITVERKFTAPTDRVEQALLLLGHFCAPDSKYPVGVIKSVYYDTRTLDAYEDKAHGQFLKTKVRARWYAEEKSAQDGMPLFIEVKHRLGGGRRKLRRKLQVSRAWMESVPLDDPALRTLLYDHTRDLGEPLPADLFPVICIAYSRHRFVCSSTGARVCLDFDIRAERVNPGILSCRACPSLGSAVFEIKDVGQVDIPWLDALYGAGFRSRSFSKYGECIRRTLEGGAPL